MSYLIIKITYFDIYVETEPSLRHLSLHYAATSAAPTDLESWGQVRVGEGEEGLTQGRPGSSGRFCVGLHQDVRKLDVQVRVGGGGEEGGGSVFGNDDRYLFGPPGIVFPALERFTGRILARCSLRLQRSKTEVFCWGDLLPRTPADLKRAGMEVNGVFEPGMECYRIGIGLDGYINAYLESIVEEIKWWPRRPAASWRTTSRQSGRS